MVVTWIGWLTRQPFMELFSHGVEVLVQRYKDRLPLPFIGVTLVGRRHSVA